MAERRAYIFHHRALGKKRDNLRREALARREARYDEQTEYAKNNAGESAMEVEFSYKDVEQLEIAWEVAAKEFDVFTKKMKEAGYWEEME